MVTIHETLKERGETHGDFVQQSAMVEKVLEILEATPNWRRLTPPMKYSIRLTVMKQARILHGDPDLPDHWWDIIGYCQLVFNILKKIEPKGPEGYPKWMSEDEPNKPGTPADGGHHERHRHETDPITPSRPSEENTRGVVGPLSKWSIG